MSALDLSRPWRTGVPYRFAGNLVTVQTLNGDTVKVDNEGSAQGDNQTTQTLERAGIGTAIGAIIGSGWWWEGRGDRRHHWRGRRSRFSLCSGQR